LQQQQQQQQQQQRAVVLFVLVVARAPPSLSSPRSPLQKSRALLPHDANNLRLTYPPHTMQEGTLGA
jgi:hypothetical protein